MRKLTTLFKLFSIVSAAAALFACGKSNSTTSPAVMLDSSGKHVANWVKTHPTVAQTSVSPCTECHGSDLLGGISKVSCMSTAISGFSCHVKSPADNAGCTSCHGGTANGSPNDSTNLNFPNRQFNHGAHTTLPNVTCDACHSGHGFGTANHANGTTAVTLLPALQAKTVNSTFSYNAVDATCSGVSCHGDGGSGKLGQPSHQPTPSWKGGTIVIATDCLNCHEQGAAPVAPDTTPTPQYNSFYSGLHQFHLALNFTCTDCHSIGALNDIQKHFSGLTTKTFTNPGATVGGIPTTKIGNYDASTKTCTNTTCHAGNHPGVWQ